MCYAVGTDAAEVMDDEAVEIFWAYIDEYWYTNLSTDEMFDRVFKDTADAIMANSKSTLGIIKYIVAAAAVIAVLAVVWFMVRRRRSGQDDY